jgi:hypothetical protein
MPRSAALAVALLLLTACLLACASESATRRARQTHEDSSWFGHLIAEDARQQTHSTDGSTAHAKHRLCCQRLSLQEDVDGEPVEHLDVPYNYWWRQAGVLLSASTSLEEPAQRTMRITPQGLVLDARESQHAYLRLQCAYTCCLEAAVVVRPSGVREPPRVYGGVMREPAAEQLEDERYEAWRLASDVSANARRTVGSHVRNIVASGVYESRGVPEPYLFGALPAQGARYSDEWRYRALRVCDRNNTGLFVHVALPERAEYAISELDLCFIDHELALAWGSGFCTEYSGDDGAPAPTA